MGEDDSECFPSGYTSTLRSKRPQPQATNAGLVWAFGGQLALERIPELA